MIDFSPLARERVCEVYAVSNTPAYLVRKLRGEPSTLSFARANSADDLIGLISGKDSKEVRTLEDVALAYAAMVALTYKGHANFEKLSRLRPKNLSWFWKIIAYWERFRIPSQEIAIEPKKVADVRTLVTPSEYQGERARLVPPRIQRDERSQPVANTSATIVVVKN